MNYQDLAMDRLTAESQGCLLSTEVSSWADRMVLPLEREKNLKKILVNMKHVSHFRMSLMYLTQAHFLHTIPA